MKDQGANQDIRELYVRNAPSVGADEIWEAVQRRLPASAQPTRQRSAPRRRSGLRVAVFASIAMVLVAAVAIGSFMAIRNLARPTFVLAITDDNVVSAGAQSGHWERLALASEGGGIHRYAFKIDPTNSSTLYTASDTGLFKSTDGARSWRQVSTRTDIHFITVDPASPSTLYALVYAPGQPLTVDRSDDGGNTWTDLSESTPAEISGYVLVMWVDATVSPRAVYLVAGPEDVAGTSTLWRSTDRGASWTNVKPEEADVLLQSPSKQNERADFQGTLTDADTGATLEVMVGYIDHGDPAIRYASTEEGIYKTVDAGKTWHKASAGLTSWEVWRVVADPTSASILYATTPAGIYKTTDAGATWSMILAGKGSVVLAPSSPSTLYAWTSAGLFRSDDAGGQWAELAGTGLPSRPYGQAPTMTGLLFVAADDPDILFADLRHTGDVQILRRREHVDSGGRERGSLRGRSGGSLDLICGHVLRRDE